MTRQPIRLLVVEDDADHRVLIERCLIEAGCEVRLARDGDEALLQLDGVDLILLDYRLPGADGIEVLEEIQRRDRGQPEHPSVIMVTGMGSESLVVTAMRAGAVDYVVKDPAYFRSLPAVVERAWRHHELRARARRLQGLMLVVASATDREEVFDEIVNGARELLAADNCALVLSESGLELVAQAGSPLPTDVVIDAAHVGLDRSDALVEPGEMSVRLPATTGDIVGVLHVRAARDRSFTPEEVALAETFAAFAGLAIERLRRTELERSLMVELQRTIDQRQDFIASVSHELRTPLSCILGFSETLDTHWDALAETDRVDLIARIGRHGTELKDLVDQLLDVAARQRGRQTAGLHAVELAKIVAEVVGGLSPVLAGREVRVEVPEVDVHADPNLLSRVLTNLLSNAVKYSAPEAPVEVTARQEGPHVRIDVTDHGVGLGPEELARVFEPFWRGRHATSSAARGTGIGLALVREYVQAMDGEIGVESELGEGSTFSFAVPLATRPQPAVAG